MTAATATSARLTQDQREVLAVVRQIAAAVGGNDGGVAGLVAVSPVALAALRRHLLGPLAHGAGIVACRGDAVANALLWEIRRAHLREVIEAFAIRGIRAAPIKGMAYALHVYADPAQRPMSDMDVLVEAHAFGAAAAVLVDLGFVHAGGDHQRASTHHAMTFKRHGQGSSLGWDIALDLHRHIAHADRTGLRADAWWRAATDHGADGWALAHDDALLLHVAHMARHEFVVPLVNYIDGAVLIRAAARRQQQTTDHVLERSRELARGVRMERMFSVWQDVSTRLLESDVVPRTRSKATDGVRRFANEAAQVLATPTIHEILAGAELGRWRQIRRKILLCQGIPELAALGKSALLSTAARAHGMLSSWP